jgi:NitT/TauT family transport system substrate-binding protein
MSMMSGWEQINTRRRQHLALAVKAAAGIAGFAVATSSTQTLAANSAKNKSATKIPPTPTPIPIPKPEKRSLTLATTNPAALPYLPLLVAQQKGFFAQQGLELEISEQQSAARAVAAVASGSADVVCGWLENMLAAPGRALALQSFVLLGAAPMMSLGVPTRPASASTAAIPSTLAQLRGRKIGVVALNSPTHTVALVALRRAGLRAAEIAFVSVGSPTGAQAALRSGQIDALVHMDPFMLQMEQSGEITNLADMRSPASAFEILGMHLPSSCVAAPAEFLQRFPGTAQACSDALVQALQWLQSASLRDILHLLPDGASGIDAQIFVASFERLRSAYSSDGICAPQVVSDLLQAMHDAEPILRLEKIDPLRSINNALAARSAIRLKS